MSFFDFHTHHSVANALINTQPNEFEPRPGMCYSLGIHPWDAHKPQTQVRMQMQQLATHPQVLAIGEAGLDRLAQADLKIQIELFCFQAQLAEQLKKPLIVHSVRTTSELVSLHKQLKQSIPWIIHGFRARANVAEIFSKAGFYLSFGAKYRKEALLVTPIDRLLLETDDTDMPIGLVYEQVASDLALPLDTLKNQIEVNVYRLIGQTQSQLQTHG